MGNFTFSEIITIIIVILIVFGPQRLPEIARKAGALASKARSAVDSIRTELDAEYGEVIQPLREARDEMRTAGNEVRGQITAFGKELEQTGQEAKRSVEGTVKEPIQGLKAAADAAVKPIAAASVFDKPTEPDSDNGAATATPSATEASAEPDVTDQVSSEPTANEETAERDHG